MTEENEYLSPGKCPGCGYDIDVPVKIDGVLYCLRCAADLKSQPAEPLPPQGLELETEIVMPDVQDPNEDEEEYEDNEDEDYEEETEKESVQKLSEKDEDAGSNDCPNTVQESSTDDVQEEPKEKVSEILADDAKEEVKSTFRIKKKKARDALVADPDSLSEKWRRARLIHEGHVILKTLSRNPKTGDFILDITLVHRKDLPWDAVAVTGEKNTYCLDTIKTSPWYQETRPHIDD